MVKLTRKRDRKNMSLDVKTTSEKNQNVKQLYMKEIIGLKPNYLKINNAKDKISIRFSNHAKSLILKSVGVACDTGILNGTIIETKSNKILGSEFHFDIKSKGLDPNEYFWFQIITDKKGDFEVALKDIEFRPPQDDD